MFLKRLTRLPVPALALLALVGCGIKGPLYLPPPPKPLPPAPAPVQPDLNKAGSPAPAARP